MAVCFAVVVIPAVMAIDNVPAASTHRDGCHTDHDCPSDHATYRWHGMTCVKPTSDKRTSAYMRKIRYGGLTYYCKAAKR